MCEIMDLVKALTTKSTRCSEIVTEWIDHQLTNQSTSGWNAALALISPAMPTLTVGRLLHMAENNPITWSKTLSSMRGLRLSDDSKTVSKTDDGPDYETAISEQVLFALPCAAKTPIARFTVCRCSSVFPSQPNPLQSFTAYTPLNLHAVGRGL